MSAAADTLRGELARRIEKQEGRRGRRGDLVREANQAQKIADERKAELVRFDRQSAQIVEDINNIKAAIALIDQGSTGSSPEVSA